MTCLVILISSLRLKEKEWAGKMKELLDYRNIRRDPKTNKLSFIDPDDLRQSKLHRDEPKRAKGEGLSSEHKTWLWENYEFNSNMTFIDISKRFNATFSDAKLKPVDLNIMKAYRRYGEVCGFKSYVNNETFTTISNNKKIGETPNEK